MLQTQTSQQNPNQTLSLQTKGAHLGRGDGASEEKTSGNIQRHFRLSPLEGCRWHRVGKARAGQDSTRNKGWSGPKWQESTLRNPAVYVQQTA